MATVSGFNPSSTVDFAVYTTNTARELRFSLQITGRQPVE